MTYDQATQRILDKALSLKDGWTRADNPYAGDVYTHPDLPGVALCCLSPHSVTLRLGNAIGNFVASSDDLTKHIEVVKRSIEDARAAALESRIIEIASKMS